MAVADHAALVGLVEQRGELALGDAPWEAAGGAVDGDPVYGPEVVAAARVVAGEPAVGEVGMPPPVGGPATAGPGVTMQFDGDSGNFALNGQTFALGGKDTSTGFGIQMTSLAFETVHSGFRYVLFACVFLFAFSTLITWSYYGLQAWQFLFGKSKVMEAVYKVIFCLVIVIGSAASMDKAIDFSDASLFAMSIPNLIGVYLLLPVVRREYADFLAHARAVDAGSGK
jgi:hypothetical protein